MPPREHSREYAEYLGSERWRDMRRRAFEIHGRFCNRCLVTGRLQVHHRHYRTLGREDPLADLEVLCEDCHTRLHAPWDDDRSEG